MRLLRPSHGKHAPSAGGDCVYRDYRLFAVRRGNGWRVVIHAPGAAHACAAVPAEGAIAAREAAFEGARRLVDRLLPEPGAERGG
jgi:hypothetical protein